MLFDIPILSFVRVILKACDRRKKRRAIVFDKHIDLESNNERIMKNITSKMNARLLSNAVWSCQAQQMSTYEDSDQPAYTKKKKKNFCLNNQTSSKRSKSERWL